MKRLGLNREKFVWNTLISRLGLFAAVLCCAGCATSKVIGLGEFADSASDSVTAGATTHEILVASARAYSDNPKEFFTGKRAEQLAMVKVDVSVPARHRTGRIEKSNNRRANPRRHFAVGVPTAIDDADAFIQHIDRALLAKAEDHRDVLLFVHGYNTSFSSALLRLTQFVHDTNYQGVPVLFTWASSAHAVDYVYDLNSALQARRWFAELAGQLRHTQATNLDVIAHSMGALLTLEGLHYLQAKADGDNGNRVARLILASPDIDFDLFKSQLSQLVDERQSVYVLISNDDRALSLSRLLAGGVPRTGAADPVAIAKLGVNVIDISDIRNRRSSNHSKFASSPEIVQLLGRSFGQGNTLDTAEPEVSSLTRGFWLSIARIPSRVAGVAESLVITLSNRGKRPKKSQASSSLR